MITMLFLSVCLPPLSLAASGDECLSCHGVKGSKLFVDRVVYGQSVHGAVRCTGCHIDIVGYPHRKDVMKVPCFMCHLLGSGGAPTAEAQQYKLSVHGKAMRAGVNEAPRCQTCHGSHYVFLSKDERSRTYRLKIPALCSQCHPAEYKDYAGSIHGKKVLESHNGAAATCFDCHSEHAVSAVDEPQWKISLSKQCGSCHSEQMDTYQKTYHGKVLRLGYATAARCPDCHGSHNILPASDKAATLSEEHLLTTCLQCHPKATAGFAKFYAHPEEHNRAKYPVLYYTYWFMTFLLIGVFTFFFTHTFLWAYRALKERGNAGKGGD